LPSLLSQKQSMKTKKKLKLWTIKKSLPGKIQNHISKSIQNCSHRCAQTLAYPSNW
jgi:phosphorylcholine metabolism protein LicD